LPPATANVVEAGRANESTHDPQIFADADRCLYCLLGFYDYARLRRALRGFVVALGHLSWHVHPGVVAFNLTVHRDRVMKAPALTDDFSVVTPCVGGEARPSSPPGGWRNLGRQDRYLRARFARCPAGGPGLKFRLRDAGGFRPMPLFAPNPPRSLPGVRSF